MYSLSDRFSIGSCLLAGPETEPEITTAGAEAWRVWWASLTYPEKATWASGRIGEKLTWPADSTKIINAGRLYYEGSGGKPIISPSGIPGSLGEEMAIAARNRARLVLAIGAAGLVAWLVLRKRK